MRVILVRHAEAAAKGADGIATDFDRPLTEHGREQAARLARSLQAAGVRSATVVTSPLVRARQTAEQLAPLLANSRPEPTPCDYLAVGELRPKKLARFVQELGSETTVLVGHNPDLSAYLEWLIGADEHTVDMEKAAAAQIEFRSDMVKGEGRLMWLVTPAWFMPTGSVTPGTGVQDQPQ